MYDRITYHHLSFALGCSQGRGGKLLLLVLKRDTPPFQWLSTRAKDGKEYREILWTLAGDLATVEMTGCHRIRNLSNGDSHNNGRYFIMYDGTLQKRLSRDSL